MKKNIFYSLLILLITFQHYSGQAIDWIPAPGSNPTISGSAIAGAPFNVYGTAWSEQSLLACENGAVEMEIDIPALGQFTIGFAKKSNPTNILYGFLFAPSGPGFVSPYGTEVHKTTPLCLTSFPPHCFQPFGNSCYLYEDGDKFRIERINNRIRFYHLTTTGTFATTPCELLLDPTVLTYNPTEEWVVAFSGNSIPTAVTSSEILRNEACTGEQKLWVREDDDKIRTQSFDDKVGIGKVPTTELDVQGQTSISSLASPNQLVYADNSGLLNLSNAFSDGSFIGIGNQTPNTELDVQGQTTISSLASPNKMVFADANGVLDISNAYSVGPLIGIGTPSPSHTLDVDGMARVRVIPENTSFDFVLVEGLMGEVNKVEIGHLTSQIQQDDQDWLTLGGSSPLSINNNIYTNGNVGIDTNNPSTKLHIAQTGDGANVDLVVEGRIQTGREDQKGGVWLNQAYSMFVGQHSGNDFGFWSGGQGWHTLNIHDVTGNVGIGGPVDPNCKLTVWGDACKPGGGTWNAPSDRRLKSKVNKFTDGLERIMKINPVKYYYTDKSGFDSSVEHIGVIAQEIREVAPYMVNNFENNGEEFLSVNNSSLTYILVNAMKEQQAIINKQKALLESFSSELKTIKESVKSICNDGCGHQNEKTNYMGQESSKTFEEVILKQNIPNPSIGQTTIQYYIPKNLKDAALVVFDLQGKLVYKHPISNLGKGEVILYNDKMGAGMYIYGLTIGEEISKTFKMIIAE